MTGDSARSGLPAESEQAGSPWSSSHITGRVRPLILDLVCGAGGAGMGYHQAGFDVLGVDVNPQPNYPFPFIQGDALAIGGPLLATGRIDAVHASPPCQAYSRITKMHGTQAKHPDLVDATRGILLAAGVPYVIENVEGAPLHAPVTLCGSMFGLGAVVAGQPRQLRRHRLFEASWPLIWPSRCPRRVVHRGLRQARRVKP